MPRRRKSGHSKPSSSSPSSSSSSPTRPQDAHEFPEKLRKFSLTTFAKLPSYLADNEHIKSGYRVHFSWRLCLRSMFRLHNETMNIWTHFVASLMFVGLMFLMLYTVSPHGFDYLHLGENTEHDHADLAKYRAKLQHMVDSLRSRAPNWSELSDRLAEIGKSLKSHMRASVTLNRLKRNLDRLHRSVTEMGSFETLQRINEYRKDVQNNLEHAFSELPHIPAVADIPSEMFDSTKHRLQEIASFLRSLHVELPDIPATLPDPLAFLPIWPLVIFIAAAIACLLFSSIFHLFFCRSAAACGILHSLDVFGICLLIAGTAVPVLYYGFYCSHTWRNAYLSTGVCVPLLAFCMTMSKSMMSNDMAHWRAIVFMFVGLVNLFPMVHLIFLLGYHDGLDMLVLGGCLYILGAIVYSLRVPERFAPGFFDIWFHSHSIFHLLVVLAASSHYVALTRFFQWRMLNACVVSTPMEIFEESPMSMPMPMPMPAMAEQ